MIEPHEIKESLVSLQSGDTLKVQDDGTIVDFHLFTPENSYVGDGSVVLEGSEWGLIYEMKVNEEHRGSGKATEIYRGMLDYLAENHPSVSRIQASAANPHMASIFARNTLPGWKASFKQADGKSFTADELLDDPEFKETKRKVGSMVLLNFVMTKSDD